MRAVFFLVLLLSLSLPFAVTAQGSNAGFVQGLWYSQEKVFAGDAVRIYAAIRNNTGSDLTGTVEFFDGEKRIERKAVQALDGRIIESWADWIPAFGSHTLSANLTRIELHAVGSSTQAVEVTGALAEDIIFIDYDTDKDGIGNEDDTDDDGDGVSDANEKQNGTDPLVKNSAGAAAEDEEQEEAEADEESRDKDNANTQSSEPQGLERFLADSPAENVLSSVTRYITAAKQDLDEYREERKEKQGELATTTKSAVNADGFGEVTRATSSEQSGFEFEFSDFFTSVFKLIGVLFNTVYTIVLAALSFVLAHPIFVQLGILILILFLLVKFAAKFGKRPKKY